MAYTREAAETLGLEVLGWLVGQEDLIDVFLGSTGTSEAELRARAADPEFLGSVMDFLLMNDAWVIRFCDDHGLAYDRLMLARAALPGGDQVHWT